VNKLAGRQALSKNMMMSDASPYSENGHDAELLLKELVKRSIWRSLKEIYL
jgi:hypothetical protein